MPKKNPIGSQVIAINQQSLSWAIDKIINDLPDGAIKNLKVKSGEHIAAILLTAYFSCAPIKIDSDGGVDFTFDFHDSQSRDSKFPALGNQRFADFEVKSLPGQTRMVDSKIQRAEAIGADPGHPVIRSQFMSANDVLSGPGRGELSHARQQLVRKSQIDHSRNVFLISHFFDYPIVEIVDAPIIAHHLTPLEEVTDIDSLWIIYSPTCIAVWSTLESAWASLVFTQDVNELPSSDEALETLQLAEMEFLEKTGSSWTSPYVYGLSFGDGNADSY